MAKPTRSKLCPHLGLKSDPTTALHFASMGNYCHHVNPPEVVRDSHQTAYCLLAEHVKCPIYLAPLAGRMPRKYRAGKGTENKKKTRVGTLPVVIGLVLLVLAAFLVPELTGPDGLLNRASGGAVTPSSTPTPDPLEGVFPTSLGTSATKSGLRPFCQPPPSWNPYIVTRVDTFEKLSRTYARSVEELLDANCRTDVNDLEAGDRIYLPELPTATPTLTPTVTLTPTRRIYTYVPLLPTWTGEYTIIRRPTDTPTPVPTNTPVPPTAAPPTAIP